MDGTEAAVVPDETQSPLVIDHGERVSEIQAPDDGLSELDKHKRDRGYTKPTAKTEPEPPPLQEAAQPETPEPKKRDERWSDPETGDTYDMRHKVARRIKAVLEDRGKVRSELEQTRKERDELMRALLERNPQKTTEPTQTPQEEDPEPNPDDTAKYPEGQFDRGFIRDQAKWAARQETKQFKVQSQTEREQERFRAAEAQAVTQWQGTLPEAVKKYPDFEEVLGRIPTTPENAPIVRLMMGSPVGNDVVYVLGTQPEAMEAYRRAPTVEHRMRLLYHIEAQIIAAQRGVPKTPATTRAPQPTEPVHTGGGAAQGIDWSRTDDPDQYARWKAQRQNRR